MNLKDFNVNLLLLLVVSAENEDPVIMESKRSEAVGFSEIRRYKIISYKRKSYKTKVT